MRSSLVALGIAAGAVAAWGFAVVAPPSLVTQILTLAPGQGMLMDRGDMAASETLRAGIVKARINETSDAPAATPADPLAGVKLRSTWRVGARAGALIETPDGRPRHLVVGDTIGEAVLESVGSSEATFSSPLGETVLRIPQQGP